MLRIIIPFHNAAPWIERCLDSIRGQSLRAWCCHLADDCSNDNSLQTIRKSIECDSRFVLTQNSERLYQSGSYRRLLNNPTWNSQDICISVDADDYLPDEGVFQRVMNAYSDGQTWLTWGNHRWTDGHPSICGPLQDSAQVRHCKWRTSHLRTWRLFLWRRIRPQDFLGPDHQPLRVAGDMAAMFPMIEMAGNRHIQYLDTINYVYNRSNLESNFRVRPDEQLRNAAYLRAKPSYQQLPDDAMHRLSGNASHNETHDQ